VGFELCDESGGLKTLVVLDQLLVDEDSEGGGVLEVVVVAAPRHESDDTFFLDPDARDRPVSTVAETVGARFRIQFARALTDSAQAWTIGRPFSAVHAVFFWF